MPFVTMLPEGPAMELESGAPLTDVEFSSDEAVITFGCRVGSCGSCVVEILAFDAPLDRGEEEERAFLRELGFSPDRHRLACQTRVHADLTIRVPER
jgi:ferredoxin